MVLRRDRAWGAWRRTSRTTRPALLAELRRHATDPRWRAREAVAMALQRLGDADMDALLDEMERWAGGRPLEQRAAAAALCEPRLLRDPAHAARVLAVLDADHRVHPGSAPTAAPTPSRRCARVWATAGASPSSPCPPTA